jgi:phosphodiesterase/alkaline phosphatase D-like protein
VATDSDFNNLVPGYDPKTPIYDTSYLVSNINPETQYYYRVVANNAAGESFYSNSISVKTTYLPFPIMRLKLEETTGSIAYDSASSHDAILDGTISFQQP